MRPLFDQFPSLIGKVAHLELATLPTPVEPLPIGSNTWIKRDDISHPVYGGNKLRKLEFIIADALRRGQRRIVTFGATGTNHGVATAMVCRQVGLQCRIYLFDQPVTSVVRQNLRLMLAFGAELKYCRSLAMTVSKFYTSLDRLKAENCFLFAGGSTPIGTLGFVNAAFELRQQIREGLLPQPHAIVCPVGSGATLAGLTLGMSLAQLSIEVIGVRVAASHLGPIPTCTRETVRKLMRQTNQLLAKHLKTGRQSFKLPSMTDDQFGTAYGAATDEALEAAERFRRIGVALESTYSAKAAAALLKLQATTKGPMLFWNTFNSRPVSKLAESADIQHLPDKLRQCC